MAADKAEFGNTLLRFIESEWALALFTKSFYNRLSMCFGHIAHYVESMIMQSPHANGVQTLSLDTSWLRIIPCCEWQDRSTELCRTHGSVVLR